MVSKYWFQFVKKYNGAESNLICPRSLPSSSGAYDEVSDLGYWCSQRPKFKITLRLVKLVLSTQMLSLSIAYNVISCKKSKETLKKNANFSM